MLNEEYNYKEINFKIDSTEACITTSKPMTQLLIILVIETVLKKMFTSKTLLKKKKEKLLQLATKYELMINDFVDDKGAETFFKKNFISILRELALETNDSQIFNEAMNETFNTFHKYVLNDEIINKEKLTKEQKKDGL